jgi:hypothetical protein
MLLLYFLIFYYFILDISTILNERKSTKNSFQKNLSNLVYKLCLDHPHHTLPQLFALKNEGQIGDKISGKKFIFYMSISLCKLYLCYFYKIKILL